MSKIPITLDVNGVPYELLADPGRSLADVLRDDLGLTGTKRACNEGECASCAVHLDGEHVRSTCQQAGGDGDRILRERGIADGIRRQRGMRRRGRDVVAVKLRAVEIIHRGIVVDGPEFQRG